MPFVIHRIGVGWFGVVSIAQVIMVYLTTVSDYGFNLTATRDIVLNREVQGTDKLSRIFSTVLFTKLAITAIAFLVLLLLVSLVPFLKTNFNLYLSGFTYVIGQSLLVSWFFQGMEKMKFITYSVLLARIIFAVLIFIFINDAGDAYLFLFFFGLGNIIAGIFSIYMAMYIFKLKLLAPLWSDMVYELWNGWQIMISNLSINTYYTVIFLYSEFLPAI
jgi:PST family polysaccharide transporter